MDEAVSHARLIPVLVLSLICTAVPQQFTARSFADIPSGPAAEWKPRFEFDGELFPSLILALNGGQIPNLSKENRLGDPLGLASVVIRTMSPNSRVHVEVQIDGFSGVSAFDGILPVAGQTYQIAPVIRYNYSRLAMVRQSMPATVQYLVKLNGSEVGRETTTIRIRSVNDVPFLLVDKGRKVDLSPLFAGFVNESHPYIQEVLRDGLRWKAVNSFDGYQRGEQNVIMQVFAIWNVLQRHHLHYSNTTTPSAQSPSGKVYSQAVRFVDQSISSQQANCVDGSVLFASILYKIGIDPILVQMPGHMFVGYYLDSSHSKREFLETTKLGQAHQPGTYNIPFSPILHPVESSESWQQFLDATRFANSEFSQQVSRRSPDFKVIDVAKARKAGINSIPSYSR